MSAAASIYASGSGEIQGGEICCEEHAVPAMSELLAAFVWPSEAFWRHFEIEALRGVRLSAPALELGCGDGSFSELAGLRLDEGIDINPRAVARAQRRGRVYGSVRCCDMREMAGQVKAPVRTIFANSVLEHVPGVQTVLSECAKLLTPGGQLVTTVPLKRMNDHLLVKAGWYAEFRRRQLEHHNLWSLDDWHGALERAGFAEVTHIGYLSGEQCRFWDAVDVLGALGVGRYTVGTGLRRLVWPRLPSSLRTRFARVLARALTRVTSHPAGAGEPCAAVLVATAPTVPPPRRAALAAG